jgi:hypothetical protein
LTFLLGRHTVIRYSRIKNDGHLEMLKSQDILIALKLASLELRLIEKEDDEKSIQPGWQGWEEDGEDDGDDRDDEAVDELARYRDELAAISGEGHAAWTYADLSRSLNLSASECNAAVKRGLASGLLRRSRQAARPLPAGKPLTEFLVHGLKYVFPAVEGRLVRGVPTAFAAPVLAEKLLTAGEHEYVWEDARGRSTGLSIEPLHKSVPFAVRSDPLLYELLALVDAIRFGKLRESPLAAGILTTRLSKL